MKLSIVIPALNEEGSIGGVIEKTLAERSAIEQQGGISDVEIVVVSDGSTDRTAEIASSYQGIKIIVFERNRGYGAAIKEGFAKSSGEIVGFMDADGTCNPGFFGILCSELLAKGADVAVGDRMGQGTEMPLVRRIGNIVYAIFLSAIANIPVCDAASGMRVILRSSLRKLYPLPDGLNFTPAMSAKAVLDEELSMIEIPMDYKERIGRSKLKVVRDGWRFFRSIGELALIFRPLRSFGLLAMAFIFGALVLGAYPLEYYLHHGSVLEWMIYRFLFCSLLASLGVGLIVAGAISERVLDFVFRGRSAKSFARALLERILSGRSVWIAAGGALVIALVLVAPGIIELATTGHVVMHWSRAVLASFVVFVSFEVLFCAVVFHVINLASEASFERSKLTRN